MCGIIGYVGPREAGAILVEGLGRLEYRGYDSAGLAIHNGGKPLTRKVVGRVQELQELLRRRPVAGTSGIAHTRWATHGEPSEENAHPQMDCSRNVAVVHNGIIENADALRMRLTRDGHRFATGTDTETLAHLIEEADGETLEDKVASALDEVHGTYGIAVISGNDPGKIVVARRGSPLLLGVGDEELFVASDASAILAHTRSVIYLDDGDIGVVTRSGYRVIDSQKKLQERAVREVDWELDAIELGDHEHFMVKEIFEQQTTVERALAGRILLDEGSARLNGLNLGPDELSGIRRILMLGCGTSFHAGLIGRHIIEELARIPVRVEYASEYRHLPTLEPPGTLVVAISQSGETADTLEALRAVRASGTPAVGLVNVVGSTIARETDGGIYLRAGPEIGVASTKVFTSQIVALLLLGLLLGRQRETLSAAEGKELARQIVRLPELVRETLALEDEVRKIAEIYAEAGNFLYLGRGVNFPAALEGALKLKEISYIHAEGFPAAEMKHGPIALIDREMPVVVIAPSDPGYPKMLANIHEVKARGGRIIALSTNGNGDLTGLADHEIRVPETPHLLSPVITAIPLQLLAYHIALLRGCDVDKPRNLAKSVTV